MVSPVIVKGNRVSLRIFTREDVHSMWDAINTPEILKYLRTPSEVFYFEDEEEWYDRLRKNKSVNRTFAIETNSGNDLVGAVSLHMIDFVSRHGELGYMIFKSHWGQGYATEAIKLMLDYSRTTLNLRKVYAYVKDTNAGSKRVLEKNGLQQCGVFREHEYVPGEGFMDLLAYEVFL